MTIPRLIHGDCLVELPRLAADGVRFDAVVTDPPYELGFMGRKWDSTGIAARPETWRAVYDAMKPGAHLVAFGGTRTYHRMVCAIEDAGFEVRDCLSWMYGSGFPKSHDVSKGIDRAAGAVREVVGRRNDGRYATPMAVSGRSAGIMGEVVERLPPELTAPATPDAALCHGWGTALKPAMELICLARKPLIGTVATNVLQHGTGAINIDGCRVGTDSTRRHVNAGKGFTIDTSRHVTAEGTYGSESGRWPANVMHDGSPEVLAAFAAFGERSSGGVTHQPTRSGFAGFQPGRDNGTHVQREPDAGTAARFFYTAKADAADRADSKHPTVKPIDLMRWLVRLVTPLRVVDLVCVSCDNVLHENKDMPGVRQEVYEPPHQRAEVLFGGMPSGGQDNPESPLPDMRQADAKGQGSLLFQGLSQRGFAQAETTPSDLRILQDGIPADKGQWAEVLQSALRCEGQRTSEKEGEPSDGPWLHDALSPRSSNGVKAGLSDGAPSYNGGTDRPAAAEIGGSASHQSGEVGQSHRQSCDDDEGRSRQNREAPEISNNKLSSLPGGHSVEQRCPHCNGLLQRVERPGHILDCFAGSGTTGEAAMLEGFDCTLIERDDQHAKDIQHRIRRWSGQDAPLFAQQGEETP